jgi:uncharacterized protein (TIRG00374 family)
MNLLKNRTIHNPVQKINWNILAPVLLMLLLGLVLILFDRERIVEILRQADWKYLPGALCFVACSHILVSISYVVLAPLAGIKMPVFELAATFFVTNILNRLVRSGGAAGFTMRYWIMKPYGNHLTDVLNSSFIHYLLGSLIMLALFPIAIIYILVTQPVTAAVLSALIFLTVLGLLMGFAAASVLFNSRLRALIAKMAVWLVKKIARRDISPLVNDYIQRASRAVDAMKQGRKRTHLVMLLLLAEWVCSVIALDFCLKAFGPGYSFINTAAIFVISTLIGVIAALPGGIGIQEAIITSLVVLQGGSFEQAVLSAILYRILQTFLPYLLSFAFYPRLLRINQNAIKPTDVRI